jgi:hypothetical protein
MNPAMRCILHALSSIVHAVLCRSVKFITEGDVNKIKLTVDMGHNVAGDDGHGSGAQEHSRVRLECLEHAKYDLAPQEWRGVLCEED